MSSPLLERPSSSGPVLWVNHAGFVCAGVPGEPTVAEGGRPWGGEGVVSWWVRQVGLVWHGVRHVPLFRGRGGSTSATGTVENYVSWRILLGTTPWSG